MSAFTALSKEALFDAIRRRIVAAVILLCLFSLMAIDGFTSCAGNVSLNGEDVQLAEMAGATGAILFVALGLWIAVLAAMPFIVKRLSRKTLLAAPNAGIDHHHGNAALGTPHQQMRPQLGLYKDQHPGAHPV